MKILKKPLASTADAGFEAPRTLPSELHVAARGACAR